MNKKCLLVAPRSLKCKITKHIVNILLTSPDYYKAVSKKRAVNKPSSVH